MIHRLALILCLLAGAALAEERMLTAAEIDDLLRGNTAHGFWGEDEYRQSFRRDGTTTYAVKGRMPSIGRWRVNAETDRYESWWERSGWDGYKIAEDDGILHWVSSGGLRYPFSVLPGEKLAWD